MGLRSDSVAGVRFLAAVHEGRGIKPAARSVGIHSWTGYRLLREAFLALRRDGLDAEQAQADLGCFTAKAAVWEQEFLAGLDGRHHLQVRVEVESIFWAHYDLGGSLSIAGALAGVSRTTGYRWLQAQFKALRDSGMSRAAAARQLRLSRGRSKRWELERRQDRRDAAGERVKAERNALRDSGRHVQLLELPRRPSPRQARLAGLEQRYWELMRAGVSNTEACRLLGMHRKSGTRIRKKSHHQTLGPLRPTPDSGRYLSLRERLQIADLERLGYSIRKISIELGRHPSTVKREMDRNRDPHGRYLPHGADDAARLRRRRPREHKLVASPRLRTLVQRKLNRYWSPDEISGWLRLTYPTDHSMRLCAETIYRALLLPNGRGLDTRYCASLRTGRRIRKSRWLTRNGNSGAVTNMTMIDKRPAEVETKITAGNWEGDLILGTGCASAMVTLRERKTQYGIIVNLPHDHTAATVNKAVAGALAKLPRHLKKTLTWDQGTEMARHLELTAATGIDIYFAERSSPWQRGANENFNGLLRQYFPKGTDLSIHSHTHVAHVMEELNNRPRKLLGYRTPKQALRAETRPPTVTFKTLDNRPKQLECCNDY
jgi:transposase, IS30 family